MRDERWTVMVLSDAAEPVRRLSLRPDDVRRLAMGVPVLGAIPLGMVTGVCLWLMTAFLPGLGWNPGVDPIQAAVQEELGETYERVQGLEAELAQLEEREARLRVLAGLEDANPENARSESAGTNGGDSENSGGSGNSTAEYSNGGASASSSSSSSSSSSWSGAGHHLFWAPPSERDNGASARLELAPTARLDLEPVERRSRNLATNMDVISDSLDARRTLVRATPSILPASGYVSSAFSHSRPHPIHGDNRPHTGIDVAAMPGTPIHAAADGEVTFSGYRGGYGQMVEIEHGHGYRTLYAHSRNLLVSEGQWVERGDLIAEVGNTGTSTGPHVHFEVHVDGEPVDPQRYVPSTHAAAP